MANAIIIVGSLLMVAACIGAAVSLYGTGHKKQGSEVNTSNRSIQSLCEPTSYKEACVESLNHAAPNTTDPRQLVKASFQVAKQALTHAIGKSAVIERAKTDPRTAQALEICTEVMTYAANDLEKSVNSVGKFEDASDLNAFLEDLKIWMGSAVTYQDTCFDAFENCTDTEPGQKIRAFFNASRELTSNALTMMDSAKSVINSLNIPGLNLTRRLLADNPSGSSAAGDVPGWIKDTAQRKLLDVVAENVKATVVVAQDGSGQAKTIGEALAKNPNKTDAPFVVRIKAGVYKENVIVDKPQSNVYFIGDGPTKTVITGSKSFADGVPVYKTATVAIIGDGFVAKDIGFENTAGATKHQALALRVNGDYAIFDNCQVDGFQSTLLAVRGRQFYRDCTIKGTVDTIFGDAQAVFQNCRFEIKKPQDNQDCTVSGQTRNEPHGPGGFVLQNATIVADPQFTESAKANGNKAFLGRPGKKYSRTIVMQSTIEGFINSDGWTPWTGNIGQDTAFLAEYGNKGPGSDTSKRVNWKSVNKNLSAVQAQEFSPDAIYKGSGWITPTGCPYTPGLMA